VTQSKSLDGEDARYAAAVGARLRAVRRQKHMSLQAVEKSSGLEFKASVLGAYERGERTISVPRLQRLARLYHVPVEQLLPSDSGEPLSRSGSNGSAGGHGGGARSPAPTPVKIAVDLALLAEAQGPESELLRRYLSSVQLQRQDFNGEVLTIRTEDLRVMASMLGETRDDLVRHLGELGLIRGY
jgi:transcriptional regulator with XRE-family HTH domain